MLCCPYKDMLALEQRFPCPFEFFSKCHQAQVCAHSENGHQGSGGTAGGALLEPTQRVAAVRGEARGQGALARSGQLGAVPCQVLHQAQAVQPFVHTGVRQILSG